ncbi:MAG: polyphosphate polymerase domain-containing protein [Candidatus Faecousia sp.]|nr:polyphosphate polymerase domain-containing protein [Candidatus Faecousia sp.]
MLNKVAGAKNYGAQNYRHEFKFLCDEAQLTAIQCRIQPVMQLDAHTNAEGVYHIRSLYFDDFDNRCYFENESGTDPREKFRIRIYNGSTERISLELKRKERGKTLKRSCRLTQEQCRILMRGEVLPDDPAYPPVLQKLLLLMKTTLMQPKVIVEYVRVPYVYPLGNVRVTFDRDISASTCIADFLEPEVFKRPVMPGGTHILEVKYDEYLPDYLHNLLQMDFLRYTSYSKYYYCRKFSI